MRWHRPFQAALIGTVLAIGITPPGAAIARPAAQSPIGTTVRTVTLVTGDRVTVVIGQRPTIAHITPGAGRKGISFAVSQFGGHLRVIPSDAVAGLARDSLDPRLFDVTTLLDFGYDDRRQDLPLIAQRAALKVRKSELASRWHQTFSLTGTKLWLDGLRKPLLDVSVPQIKAPEAWAAGYTGAGVKVGVVDTGIDATHPDLAGKVIAARDFVGEGDQDVVGHGTHVAATIASNDSRYRGVAPGAQLIAAKVCLEFGCPESAILEGMQWAVEQGAKVVNMSLGGSDGPGIDPLEAAVQDLTARYGVLFVIAAGNAGGDETVGSPGSADSALTVGAVDKQDHLAGFSSRGPRVGDAALKPDVTAPGVDIVAAWSKDAPGGGPGRPHMSLSGTSMATPHVAGAAAILVQQHPTWSPAQLKAALMGSALSNADIPIFAEGAGRIDVSRAITQKVLADPPSVSFGRQPFPHGDDEVRTRTLSYTNTGAQDVALGLSLAEGQNGMFALSTNTLTVPAGGSASVTVTADTRIAVPDAKYGGYVVAQGGGMFVSTPFAVDKEDERYNVTVNLADRKGQPTDSAFGVLVDPVTDNLFFVGGPTQTTRVPKGHYLSLATVFDDTSVAMVSEAETTVDHDLTITLDASKTAPVDVTLPLKDAVPALAVASAVIGFTGGNGALIAMADPGILIYTGSRDPARTSPHLTGAYAAFFTPNGDPASESAYLAETAWHQPGRLFQGLRRHLKPADLAKVEVTYAGHGLDTALVRFGPSWTDLRSVDNPVNLGAFTALPSARAEYHNTDSGLRWAREMYELDADGNLAGNVLFGPPTTLRGGATYQETRNQAVFGPGFANPVPSDPLWLSRQGDTMVLVPTIANDRLNWYNTPADATMHLTLDRNGQRLLDRDSRGEAVDVPPGAANYRLAAEVTRGGSPLSTKVSCVWTFSSSTTPADVWTKLPLSAIRFLPALDEHGVGRSAVLPLQVQRQPGSDAGSVRTLSVDVSYDDGATWRKMPVIRLGQLGFAALNHPAGAKFISIRAQATDTKGNTVNETIIRAYQIG